jgi:hypothetical protein
MTQMTQIEALNAEMAEFDNLVAAKNGSMEWTRKELASYFKQVENRENWKLAIDADVVLDNDRDLLGVREAVIFFTGSVPTMTPMRARGGRVTYRVQAAGYYVAIGA